MTYDKDKRQKTRALIFCLIETALFVALGFVALGIAVQSWTAQAVGPSSPDGGAGLSPIEYFAAGAVFLFGLQTGIQNICYLIRNKDKFR